MEDRLKTSQETPNPKRKKGRGVQSKELSPLHRQSKVSAFYKRKSPKAASSREKVEKIQFQGAVGPLLGDMGESPVHGDHPTDEALAKTLPSAQAGWLVERGRATRIMEGEKRNEKFLEIEAQGPKGGKRGFTKKGLKGNRREERDSQPEKVQDIRRWFEARGRPPAKPPRKEVGRKSRRLS